MLRSWTRGLLHLLVGGACAALVGWLAFGFWVTLGRTGGGMALWATAGLVALGVVVAAVLLLAPPVRPAEVALARSLLDVELAEPSDVTGWESRGRGLLWAVVVIGLGGLSLLALLWCTPQGAWLLLAAADGSSRDELVGDLAGWPPALLALAGLGLLTLGIGVQPLLVVLLRALARSVLGPTAGDRLALAERERERLLRRHTLARELHDSVGHALSAIGVQAEAGARVAERDPAFARAALERIAEVTREAVAELDDVLGVLRRGAEGDQLQAQARTERLLAGQAPGVRWEVAPGKLTEEAAGTAYRVLQEALTNARRHGSGPASGHVVLRHGQVEILVRNALATDRPGATRPAGGRGLTGLAERLELLGGTVSAGPEPDGGSWRLLARWPVLGEGLARETAS